MSQVKQKPKQPLYIQDLLPYDDVQRGLVAAGKHVAALIAVEGQDIEMMSAAERHAQIVGLADLFDLREYPMQLYVRLRRRDLSPILRLYDQNRLKEPSQQLRAQFWLDQDHIKDEAEAAGVVERLGIAVLTMPKTAKTGLAGMGGSDQLAGKEYFVCQQCGLRFDGKAPNEKQQDEIALLGECMVSGGWHGPFEQHGISLGERIKQQFVKFAWEQLRALGAETPDEQEESRRARRGESITEDVAKALADQAAQFAEKLTANRLRASVMGVGEDGIDETIALLAQQMGGGAKAGRDGTAPRTWHEAPDHLQLGGRYVTVLFASSLPAEVYPGILMPLVRLKHVEQLEISVHFQPVNDVVADRKLKEMERDVRWAQSEDAYNMKLDDVAESAAAVRRMIATRKGRAYICSIYVAVSASTPQKLREDLAKVYAVMQTLRLEPFVARLDMANAYASVLPIGYNKVPRAKLIARQTEQTATSGVCACLNPFLISSFDHPDGVVLGTSIQDGSLVRINPRRFGSGAGMETFIAETGAGKTMDVIIEAVRQLMADPKYRYRYIDPQNGVAPFTRAIGGQSVDFNARSGIVINCMDRRGPGKKPMLVREKLSYLVGLFALMTKGELKAVTISALGRAIITLYRHFEQELPTAVPLARAIKHLLELDDAARDRVADLIGSGCPDAATVEATLATIAGKRVDERKLGQAVEWAMVEAKRGTPILSDLMPYLLAEGASELVEQLESYCNQELFGSSYNGQTNVDLRNRFVHFNVRDVEDEQKATVMYMIMDYIWQEQVEKPYWATVVADEAGILFSESPQVGKYIAKLYKRARALKLRVVSVDQNIGMFINTDVGRKIIDNSDVVKLARQAASGANVADLKAQFDLTDGQVAVLLGARKGELLVLADGKVIHSKYSISPEQLKLYDTFVEGREAEDERREAAAAANN